MIMDPALVPSDSAEPQTIDIDPTRETRHYTYGPNKPTRPQLPEEVKRNGY